MRVLSKRVHRAVIHRGARGERQVSEEREAGGQRPHPCGGDLIAARQVEVPQGPVGGEGGHTGVGEEVAICQRQRCQPGHAHQHPQAVVGDVPRAREVERLQSSQPHQRASHVVARAEAPPHLQLCQPRHAPHHLHALLVDLEAAANVQLAQRPHTSQRQQALVGHVGVGEAQLPQATGGRQALHGGVAHQLVLREVQHCEPGEGPQHGGEVLVLHSGVGELEGGEGGEGCEGGESDEPRVLRGAGARGEVEGRQAGEATQHAPRAAHARAPR
mmetsp:Transcript_21546/g.47283  ORF Transcript_21546/g.47283 Transcript_21546/m.47283 type:complete len:273 (+) Transcript_21546:648-1466(+)